MRWTGPAARLTCLTADCLTADFLISDCLIADCVRTRQVPPPAQPEGKIALFAFFMDRVSSENAEALLRCAVETGIPGGS